MKLTTPLALLATLVLAAPVLGAISAEGSFTARCDLAVFAPAATSLNVGCGGEEGVSNPGETSGTYTVTFAWEPASAAYEELILTANWCDHPPGGQVCTGGFTARGSSPVIFSFEADAAAEELHFRANPTTPTVAVLFQGPPTVRIVEPAVYVDEPEQTIHYTVVHAPKAPTAPAG